MLRFLFLLLFLPSMAQAACETDSAAIQLDVDAALETYKNWQFEAFQSEKVPALSQHLSVLSAEIATTSIAQVHLVFALDAAYSKDWDAASFFIRSVRVADPGYMPDPALVAQGSDLYNLFVEEKTACGNVPTS